MAKRKSFQQALERLEEITDKLEDSHTSLEDSLKLYKEASELFVFCNTRLKSIESEVTQLRRTAAGEIVLEPFEQDLKSDAVQKGDDRELG